MIKKYVIIAGVNGAGKSTMFSIENEFSQIKKINLDELVRQYGDWRNKDNVIKAGKKIIELIDYCFMNGISFCQETTLCGKGILNNIKRAKKLGYVVELHYIGLESSEIAKARVRLRVENGGHGIPDTDIERRYDESIKNLVDVIPICDLTVIYDNSLVFKRFAIYKFGKIIRISNNVPNWYENYMK